MRVLIYVVTDFNGKYIYYLLQTCIKGIYYVFQYAIELGAKPAAEQYFKTSRTMFDPAGHPFCLDTDEPEE